LALHGAGRRVEDIAEAACGSRVRLTGDPVAYDGQI
jgi:hypothetical protein